MAYIPRTSLSDALDQDGSINQAQLVSWAYQQPNTNQLRDLNMNLSDKWVDANKADVFKCWLLYKTVGTVIFGNEKKAMAFICATIAQSQKIVGNLPNPLIPHSLEPRWLIPLPVAQNLSNNTSVATEARTALKVAQYSSPPVANQSHKELNDAIENFFGDPDAISMTNSEERLKRMIGNFQKVLYSYFNPQQLGALQNTLATAVNTGFLYTYDQIPCFTKFHQTRNLPLIEQFELTLSYTQMIQKEMQVVQDRVDSKRDLRNLFSNIASFLNIEISWERTRRASDRDPRDIIETKLRLFPKVYLRSLSLFRYNYADLYIFTASLIESFDVRYAIPNSTVGGVNLTATQIREKRVELLNNIVNAYLEMVQKVLELNMPLDVLRIILPDEHKPLLNHIQSKFNNLQDIWVCKKRTETKDSDRRKVQNIGTPEYGTPSSIHLSPMQISELGSQENDNTNTGTFNFAEDVFIEGSVEGCTEDKKAIFLPEKEGQFSLAYTVYKLKLISDACEFSIKENVEREKAFMVSSNDLFTKLIGMDVSHLAGSEMQTNLHTLEMQLQLEYHQLEFRRQVVEQMIGNLLAGDDVLSSVVGQTEETQNNFDSLRADNFPQYFAYLQQSLNFQPYVYLRHVRKRMEGDTRTILFQHSMCRRLNLVILNETNILGTEPVPTPSDIPSLHPLIIQRVIQGMSSSNTSIQQGSSANNQGQASGTQNIYLETVPPPGMNFQVDNQIHAQQVPSTIGQGVINPQVLASYQPQTPQQQQISLNEVAGGVQSNVVNNVIAQVPDTVAQTEANTQLPIPQQLQSTQHQQNLFNEVEDETQPNVGSQLILHDEDGLGLPMQLLPHPPSLPADFMGDIQPNTESNELVQQGGNMLLPIQQSSQLAQIPLVVLGEEDETNANVGNEATTQEGGNWPLLFQSIIPSVQQHPILSTGVNEIQPNIVNSTAQTIQPQDNPNNNQLPQQEGNNVDVPGNSAQDQVAVENPGPSEPVNTGNNWHVLPELHPEDTQQILGTGQISPNENPNNEAVPATLNYLDDEIPVAIWDEVIAAANGSPDPLFPSMDDDQSADNRDQDSGSGNPSLGQRINQMNSQQATEQQLPEQRDEEMLSIEQEVSQPMDEDTQQVEQTMAGPSQQTTRGPSALLRRSQRVRGGISRSRSRSQSQTRSGSSSHRRGG